MEVQTKQQKRAKFALDEIVKYKDSSKNKAEFHDFANFIVGMPNMILSNGLAQTLAFLLTKKDKQKKAFDIIKNWIQTPNNASFGIKGDTDIAFLKSFSMINQKTYIDVQNETLRLVEWLKRYARAFDEEKKD